MQVIFYIAWVAVSIIQFATGMEGMHQYFGTGGVASFFLFLFCSMFPGIGTVLGALAVYYGAKHGYGWETWQAIALAIPGIILMAIAAMTMGLASIFSRRA